jgi:hypothetical protein
MLAASAHACRLGGFVLIGLPPDGASPSAETVRQAEIGLAKLLGHALVERKPLSNAYEIPFFERNALRAAGIATPAALATWRSPGLPTSSCSGPASTPFPTPLLLDRGRHRAHAPFHQRG